MPARAELVTLGVTAGTLGIGAVAIGPVILNASSGTTAPATPSDPALVNTCEALIALLEQSLGIVRVWRDDDGNARDILVWHRDIRDPDTINRNEVVLLTFSPTMRTLASHTCTGLDEPDLAGELGIELDETPENTIDLCAAPIRRSSLGGRFAWSWKTGPGIAREILATGLSEVMLTSVREQDGSTGWGVELIWGDGASDVDREVCALVVPSVR